jgi:hypothetical protein
METVRGTGEFCERNLLYEGPAQQHGKRSHKRRDD